MPTKKSNKKIGLDFKPWQYYTDFLKEYHQLINYLFSNDSACRTASATPGLLFTVSILCDHGLVTYNGFA